jgi:DNA-binding transcriptional LysR family regulator
MVEVGLGVGIVPEPIARQYASLGHLVSVPLDEDWARRDWKLCARDTGSLARPVQLLLDHLSFAALANSDQSPETARTAS